MIPAKRRDHRNHDGAPLTFIPNPLLLLLLLISVGRTCRRRWLWCWGWC